MLCAVPAVCGANTTTSWHEVPAASVEPQVPPLAGIAAGRLVSERRVQAGGGVSDAGSAPVL